MIKRALKLLLPNAFNFLKLSMAAYKISKGDDYWAKGVFDDAYTYSIIKKTLKKDSITIDVGCAVGDILREIIKYAPNGKHYAFEPQPDNFKYLIKTFKKYKNVIFENICLSDTSGCTNFYELTTDKGYSGMKKTDLALKFHKEESYISYTVNTNSLDNIIPKHETVSFIKIDVEGAEYQVLLGGSHTIERCKPIIIFEFGEAANNYGTKSDNVYNFFSERDMQINLPEYFLSQKLPLSIIEFHNQHLKGYNNYFIAYPKSFQSIT